MGVLQNKIDFIVLAAVKDANPNGDPLNGNRPRSTYSGLGEISDVCIKRKLRNRLQDQGEKIFVQSEDRCDDGLGSLSERAKKTITRNCQGMRMLKKLARNGLMCVHSDRYLPLRQAVQKIVYRLVSEGRYRFIRRRVLHQLKLSASRLPKALTVKLVIRKDPTQWE